MKTARILTFMLLTSLCQMTYAQEHLKLRPSPLSISSMRFKDSYVKLTYSQPQRKGRQIFGNLVPYGQVWRTGANEATELTITKDMMINNQLLKAGSYSIFTIPERDKWTIIINADLGLWGSYNYNQKTDVMRFDIPMSINEKIYEPFTMMFDQRNDVADLLIMWDNIKVTIPFKFIN